MARMSCLMVTIGWAVCLAVLPLAGVAGEYGDITFKRQGAAAGMEDIPPAVFPHWVHRIQFKCQACHDELFKMKAGSSTVTMDDIREGKSCGVCHDSKIAFESNFDTCPRCHTK